MFTYEKSQRNESCPLDMAQIGCQQFQKLDPTHQVSQFFQLRDACVLYCLLVVFVSLHPGKFFLQDCIRYVSGRWCYDPETPSASSQKCLAFNFVKETNGIRTCALGPASELRQTSRCLGNLSKFYPELWPDQKLTQTQSQQRQCALLGQYQCVQGQR